jgi:glutamyl-tRNA synthetase
MILGADGERLSKRHGAVSVTQYRDDGYLPEALLNYLARLGWSHGNEEVFSKDQLVEWFDLAHVSRSAAQFDPGKLAWLSQQHIKVAPDARLAALIEPALKKRGAQLENGPDLIKVVALVKDRSQTLPELAEAAMLFYSFEVKPLEDRSAETLQALKQLRDKFAAVAWQRADLGNAIKDVVKSSGLKMPQLAMPLRLIVTGRTQTPSIDAVLELLGRETVLARLSQRIDKH